MLSRDEMRRLLSARGPEQDQLFAEARKTRNERFGAAVVLRGVIELTNVCRVNCDYCPMRRDNVRENDTYFLSADKIVELAGLIRNNGIDVILLQGGETPALMPLLEEVIPRIRRLYDDRVEILLNVGNLKRAQYERLRAVGATSYILKHETSDPELFFSLRHETLETRLRCMRDLQEVGFKVGTGLISSLPGQSLDSIIDDIELAGELGVDMCSVSPFVPAPNTPMSISPIGDNELALNVIAVLRLRYPQLLIPSVSALERVGSGGQSRGLDAGANVMTVNFSSAGDQKRYLIYGKDRFVVTLDHVRGLVRSSGLELSGSRFIEQHVMSGVGV
ncbi:radical SAM protein [Streptomyces sp. NPDC090109]|uniref:biotin synthase BioB n=1 Tax=unclassified Streptomyces TaxID=2593676 RepID=UPI001367D4CC|nr:MULTISPECIES: radical SAM protein [unclassified Streptomyces]MZE55773.1 radical SAM protein [Streptomyces sp. SID5770]